MATTSRWGTTPQQSVERECRARGRDAVVDGCLELLGGATDVDPTLVHALGGPPARWALTGDEGDRDHWLRVWAARGLLWAWDDRATAALERALDDPTWRVREMAAKVAARHRLGELLPTLARVRDADPNRRVVAACDRAVVRITAAGA